jgi:hypothetical protein
MLYMHDSAPAHFNRAVRGVLYCTFHEKDSLRGLHAHQTSFLFFFFFINRAWLNQNSMSIKTSLTKLTILI